jgi:Dolichyl-phosphate-mannose-protein mannosyltransferase
MASEGSEWISAGDGGPEAVASASRLPPPSVRKPTGRHAVSRTNALYAAGTREAGRSSQGRRQSHARQRSGIARLTRLIRHPLTLICAVQTAGCLVLVRSNTAFTDEAAYLRLGHLLIAHWLHGKSWPAAYADRVLSGAPAIYPPLGAVADSAGGLVGARILSLAFMLGGTILVYRTASRLLGRSEAAIACALWALSEPVLRLAFATYDAMSVFLVALAAWLAVEAGYRHRQRVVVLCSGAALGLGVAVAYSAIAIAPVVIAFAFLTWWNRFDAPLAGFWTAGLTATAAAMFTLVITACGSWPGIAFSIFDRKVNDYQNAPVILGDIAKSSGLIILVGLIGAGAAIRETDRRFRLLIMLLGLAVLVVPAAQFYMQTAWALDKHVAYGIWFASIAGAYGCVAIARWLRAAGIRSPGAVLAAGLMALVVIAAANWQLASVAFRSWPDATSFVSSFERAASRNTGSIFSSAQKRVAAYYAPEGAQWWLWKVTPMSLDPPGLARNRWPSYFADRLRAAGFGLIALFYDRPAGMTVPADTRVAPRDAARIAAKLARLQPLNASEPGVPVLTRALQRDGEFRLVAVGHYDSVKKDGIYAIWLRQPQPPVA